nr:Alpha-gamma-adaptin-binding protein p34 domain containing protein [Haemonchus contortus]
MMKSFEQTSEGDMSAAHRQIVAVVGDQFLTLTNRLVDAVGNDSTTSVFHLDTKYYQAHVGVRHFRNGAELLKTHKQEPDLMIGAIILKLGTKNELEIMENVVKKVDCDSHVLVVDHSMHDNLNFAQSWAHSFRFELVILNPDASQREEAKSLNEKCGIARVLEVIENVAWQLKKDNFKKITGKQGLDRLLAIIEAMSESSEDSDLEPDDEDKEAIWQAFSSCGIPPQAPETTSPSSVSKECEATVSVDVTIVKNEREPDQWFSGLLENKAKGIPDAPVSTDFNFFQAIKDTRDANMKLLDPAKRADNAAALLSKIVDLNIKDKDDVCDKKNQ